jgi:hypothetical protein
LFGRSNGVSQIQFGDEDDTNVGLLTYDHTGNYMMFRTADAERMRIDSSGRLFIGTTASLGVLGLAAQLQIAGSTAGRSSLALRRFGDSAQGAFLTFSKSRNAADGSRTIVQNGDELGRIPFCMDDGTDLAHAGAEIRANVDGTPGANDTPGRLVFLTTADGSTTLSERMRIDSSGNVGIGTVPLSRFSIAQSVSSGHMMVIRNTQTRANNVRYGIEFRDSSNETNVTIVAKQTGTNNQASMEIYANNGSGGNGITGGTSGIRAVTIGPGGLTTHKEFGMHDAGGTESAKFLDFGFQGNSCNFRRTNGSDGAHANFITVDSSNVVSGDLNDTSDEKLKKNILSVVDGAIENIKKLRPVTFDWIDETRNNDVSGFVAQEVKEVLPNLVYGTEYDSTLVDETKGSKGGIKSEGYSINTIGIVAHLTKALQEAVAKIETLETKVAALEAA